MPFTRREIREYVESQEAEGQTYTCKKCKEVKPASEFGLKTGYNKAQNKVYCTRVKYCKRCAYDRDAETARNRRKGSKGHYEKLYADVPFRAAEKLLRQRPEAVALLANTFKVDFGKIRTAEIALIDRKKAEHARKCSEAKKGQRNGGRQFHDDDVILKDAPEGVEISFAKKANKPLLTNREVAEIRAKYEIDGMSVAEIARRYKRTDHTISSVVLYRTYKHVR